MITYVMLIAGFILLIKGADLFVDGSSSIAKLLRVPTAIIGLTIVAFGTSAPELSVSCSAALQGSNEIAISNVLGSNMFNLMVVTGVCAVLAAIPVNPEIIKREFPFSIGMTILLLVFILTGPSALSIERYEGLILLAFFILYIFFQIYEGKKSRDEGFQQEDEIKSMSPFKSVALAVIGCVMIIYGGDFVVDSACEIARTFGLTETLIGLTIVALGTSLPELVTSIVASRKGENDLAIGNVVGSNVFNILMILGISTSINPIPLQSTAIFDCGLLLIFNFVVLGFCWTKKRLARIEGLVMVLLYAAYAVYIAIR